MGFQPIQKSNAQAAHTTPRPHPTRGGKLSRDVPTGTLNAILKQAGPNEVAMKYVYIMEQAPDGSYSAYVPDLPGCTSCGDTPDELHANLREAVDLYLDDLKAAGEPFPKPTTTAGHVEAA
ncbi:MAG: type II toxin-antitoxin system HicB family antitoxin [Phycisphaerae bacterium]